MTLRPPEDDEFDAMLELMNDHQLAAFGEADVTEDELRTWLTSPSVEVERDIRVLERDGRLIGGTFREIVPPHDPDRVPPELDRRPPRIPELSTKSMSGPGASMATIVVTVKAVSRCGSRGTR